MRIPDLYNSDKFLGQVQRLSSRQADLQSQVSTGQRITNPSDDPSAMGRVLKIQEEKQRLQQYTQNSNRALEINQTAYSAISELKKISDRAGEISVLGVGVIEPVKSEAYGTELNQLIEQSLTTLNAGYGGEHLFGGTSTDAPPYTATRDANGNITAVTYNGAANTAQFHVAEGEKLSPYPSAASNQQYADFINRLVSLRDAVSSGNTAGVQAAQPDLQASEDDILHSVSDLAAIQTRLEGSLTQNEARFSDLEKETSSQVDADLAQTVVQLTQSQTAYQAALQVGAQVLRVSLLDYLR